MPTSTWDDLDTDATTYCMASAPATRTFAYGDPLASDVPSLVSETSCVACHADVQAHGSSRRGLATCLLCHRTAGAEDWAPYGPAGREALATPGVTVDFRSLLHRLHMGKDLADAARHVVAAELLGTVYPVTFEDVRFPSMPGGAMDCETCHGEGSTSWHEPAERRHHDHVAAGGWRAVCGACHDSDAAVAHLDSSSMGSESCASCHGPGREWSTALVHKVR